MKRAAVLIACALLLAVFAWMRVDRTGEKALRAANDATQVEDAIANAKVAAQCRGTSWSALGFARLATIADEAEARGDVPTMKSAYVSMRSAADSIDDETWRIKANDGLVRTAMRADATPQARVAEGCSATSEPPCTNAMKLELATPTHPSRSSHGLVAVAIAIVIALGVFLTRRPAPSPKKRARVGSTAV